MLKDEGQPAFEFLPFSTSHVLNLVGEMFDVQVLEAPEPDEGGLLHRPGVRIILVSGERP